MALVFPRVKYSSGDPPLGLAYLASVLRRERPGVEVQIIDGTFLGSETRLIDRVRAVDAGLVGVTVDHLNLPVARAVARICRADGAFTLAGGPAATVAPQSLVPPFEAALIGEGEPLIASIADRALEGASLEDLPNLALDRNGTEVELTPRRELAPDLNALPFPAWDLLDFQRYRRLWPYLDSLGIELDGTNVVGSRGCSYSCAHCQPGLRSLFGRHVRRRSPESVVAEAAELQRRYGIRGLFFHDDTLTAEREWVSELCDRLGHLPRRLLWGCNSRPELLTPDLVEMMADAGLRAVHLGIEAASPHVRDEILGKHASLEALEETLAQLRQHRVCALGFFMLGSPGETRRDILQTLRLASRLDLTEATFSLTSALPGTRLHERLRVDPRYVVQTGTAIDYYNQRNFTDLGGGVSDTSLRALQTLALGWFYLRPRRWSYLSRHLLTAQGRDKLAMKAERFLAPSSRSQASG